MDFASKSYRAHEQQEYPDLANELKVYSDWFNNGTVDVWRHLRFFAVLDPFLRLYNNAKWLTVGDGRFGTGARYIANHGGKPVATDIYTSLLQIAKEEGWIDEYQYANAEALPYKENEFDFVYCKQAYHHFPRPQIALYEMLRVAQKAVILTEPADWIPSPFVRQIMTGIKRIISRLLGKKILHTDTGNYEEAGNYIFTVSEREIEKIAMAINLPAVAFKRLYDAYIPGVENEKTSENGPLFRQIKRTLRKASIQRRLGLFHYNNIQCIIFISQPDENLVNELKKRGYDFRELPRNPYL